MRQCRNRRMKKTPKLELADVKRCHLFPKTNFPQQHKTEEHRGVVKARKFHHSHPVFSTRFWYLCSERVCEAPIATPPRGASGRTDCRDFPCAANLLRSPPVQLQRPASIWLPQGPKSTLNINVPTFSD